MKILFRKIREYIKIIKNIHRRNCRKLTSSANAKADNIAIIPAKIK